MARILKHRRFLQASVAIALSIGIGFMLHTIKVNADIVHQQDTTQKLVSPAASTTASSIYVNPQIGQDSPGSGETQATPYKTITYALVQAQPGTVIQLAPGQYNKDSGEQFPLLIKQGVTLHGDDNSKGQSVLIIGSGIFISPTFARQNITIRADGNSTISGVTVTNPENRGTGIVKFY